MGIIDAVGDVIDTIGEAICDALEAAWDAVTSLFSDEPACGTTMPCPQKALSKVEAQKLFDEFKGRTDEVPFDYPRDCCYSRAHEMCRVMQERGIPCGKIWNYAHNFPEPGLSVPTPGAVTGEVTTWRYHVAPTTPVRGDDGVVRDMVIDPSMFDEPVTVEKWLAAQNDPNSYHVQTDANPYYRSPAGDYVDADPDYSKTNKMLKEHALHREYLKALKLKDAGSFDLPDESEAIV